MYLNLKITPIRSEKQINPCRAKYCFSATGRRPKLISKGRQHGWGHLFC